MSHTPHELSADFPDQVERIAELRASDARFRKLSDNYHTVNRAVHRAETDVEPTSDDHMAEMRKQRMLLKDQIYAYLAG